MRINEAAVLRIIRKELSQIFLSEGAHELSDEELDILDTGPSHPHYHRVVRKSERLGGGAVHGSGRSSRDWSLQDVMAATDRRHAATQLLKQIENERGRAAVAEPMIALGMNPNDGLDQLRYREALEAAIGLEAHLDDIIKLEKEIIFKQERDALSGERSAHDVRGELEDRCFDYDEALKSYKNNSFDCISYRRRRRGGLPSVGSSEHVYDRERLYKKIFGGWLGAARASRAAQFDPQFLKRVLDVTAKKLRPMPAYTPAESEAELQRLKVKIDESRSDRRMRISERQIRQIIKEALEKRLVMPDHVSDGLRLRRIKRICDDELMNKSLTMKGLRFNTVESIVNNLNEMMGEKIAEASMQKHRVFPPHTDAVRALEWISDFCGSHMSDAEDNLGFRAMCVRMISKALSSIDGFTVRVNEKDLHRPHPGGRLGFQDPSEER